MKLDGISEGAHSCHVSLVPTVLKRSILTFRVGCSENKGPAFVLCSSNTCASGTTKLLGGQVNRANRERFERAKRVPKTDSAFNPRKGDSRMRGGRLGFEELHLLWAKGMFFSKATK